MSLSLQMCRVLSYLLFPGSIFTHVVGSTVEEDNGEEAVNQNRPQLMPGLGEVGQPEDTE